MSGPYRWSGRLHSGPIACTGAPGRDSGSPPPGLAGWLLATLLRLHLSDLASVGIEPVVLQPTQARTHAPAGESPRAVLGLPSRPKHSPAWPARAARRQPPHAAVRPENGPPPR